MGELKCPNCGGTRRANPSRASKTAHHPSGISGKGGGPRSGHFINQVYLCLHCGCKYTKGPNGKIHLVGRL